MSSGRPLPTPQIHLIIKTYIEKQAQKKPSATTLSPLMICEKGKKAGLYVIL
jgi:hypothetical protein